MQSFELNINIGDVNISIISEKPINASRNEDLYAGYVTNNKPDVIIEERDSVTSGTHLKNKNLILDNRFWRLYHKNSYRIFILKPTNRNSKIIGVFNSDVTKGKIYLTAKKDKWLESRLGKIIVLNLLSLRSRIIFHACGILDENSGYLFLGKSGDGKTTMAKLWYEKGKTVIHDDQIIVYKKGSNFLMSGVPWNIKFNSCFPSKRALLKKIFFLEHGEKNRLYKKNSLEAFSLMVRRLLVPGWDKKALGNTVCLCSDLAKTIPCYNLAFTPTCDCIDFIKGELN